jgi:hypothetical protein
LTSPAGAPGNEESRQASTPASGQWQQQTQRKKNRKRLKSVPNPRSSASAGDVKPKPETLPANETERKGG